MASEFLKAGEEVVESDVVKTSSGSSEANKGVKLNSDGKLDRSLVKGKKFTAAEALSQGDAARITVADAENTDSTDNGTNYGINDDSSRQQRASKHVPGSNIFVNYVKLFLEKNGTPPNLTVEIRRSDPDGTLIVSKTFSESEITSNAESQLFFDEIVELTGGSDYWIVLNPSGGVDNTNFYEWEGGATSGGAGDNHGIFDGNSWSTQQNPNPYLKLGVDDGGTAGQIKKAKASNTTEARLMIGFVQSAISNGNSGFIDIIETAEGVSGLTIGKVYYLSDTAGSISTSPGTVKVKVGVAVAATILAINIQQEDTTL